jgi:hypothetical protein
MAENPTTTEPTALPQLRLTPLTPEQLQALPLLLAESRRQEWIPSRPAPMTDEEYDAVRNTVQERVQTITDIVVGMALRVETIVGAANTQAVGLTGTFSYLRTQCRLRHVLRNAESYMGKARTAGNIMIENARRDRTTPRDVHTVFDDMQKLLAPLLDIINAEALKHAPEQYNK